MDFDTFKKSLATSDAWVARAIFRLSCDWNNMVQFGNAPATKQDDKLFFDNLRQFFADNGFFTDRHIAVARQKIRDPYIIYLVSVASIE